MNSVFNDNYVLPRTRGSQSKLGRLFSSVELSQAHTCSIVSDVISLSRTSGLSLCVYPTGHPGKG